MRRLLAVVSLIVLCSGARAQVAADTLQLRSSFNAGQLIAPAVLGGAGLAVHFLGHDKVEVPLRNYVWHNLRRDGAVPNHYIDDYLRFVPVTAELGLGLAGVPARHAFVDRTIETAIAYFLSLGSGFVAKKLFKTVRPNGTGTDSFPSGHAIISFTGAGLVCQDYGWGWGAGAYGVSTFVVASRIYEDRHWLGDVLAGAGLGILCAYAGGWLLEPVKQVLGIPDIEWDGLNSRKAQLSVVPYIDPFSNSYSASVAIEF